MTNSSIQHYVAVIIKNKNSDYGVLFPDFSGCITAGKTLEEAKSMADEALQFHIDGMVEDGSEIPSATTLDHARKKYKKAAVLLTVPVRVPTKATRINITIDEKLLRKLDRYISSHRVENRSAFFAKAIEATCR